MYESTLVDTDTLSEFFRGNPKVIANFAKYLQFYDGISFSIITYYEILNGLLYKDAKDQLQKFAEFTELNKVIPLTKTATRMAAEIYSDLRKKGDPISYTDSLVAGIAIAKNMQLATANTAHFKGIEKIVLRNWMG